MRILVEPSDYPGLLRNFGDVAMQQTTVSRIAGFWPSAKVQILTDKVEDLPFYAPNVDGLSAVGRHLWMSGFLRNTPVLHRLERWESQIRRRHSRLAERLTYLRARFLLSGNVAAVDSFLEATRSADLLVICGMGAITDVFERYALDLLDTIGLVKANGKGFVVMFGQAFGPIQQGSAVEARAREIMPMVDLIGLRESRVSMPLLMDLGVDPSRVMVTGDDVLEIAAHNRSSALGDGIGINLRVASYSQVGTGKAQQLGQVLQAFVGPDSIPLVPLPSSLYPEESDTRSIESVTHGYGHVMPNAVDSLSALISQLHQCRIAIVGSYHCAVFALAQGVPVVGLYNSDYYRDKFLGLEALYEAGVFPVDLAGPKWTESFSGLLREVWDLDPRLRCGLIAAADKQIDLGWQAYNRVRKIVEQRSAGV